MTHRLEGEKRIHDDPGSDSFSDATTLFVTVRRGWDPQGTVEAREVMKIGDADLLRLLASFRVHATGAPTWDAGLAARGRFGVSFFGNL